MATDDLHRSLPSLLRELTHGAGEDGFMLNAGDVGLLGSLEKLSAEEASVSVQGGATIAAHVDHVRYGLSLMNRWADGEPNPFATADWSAAWKTSSVTADEWAHLQGSLRTEIDRWLDALAQPRPLTGMALDGVISSIAHLAYHLGAIRQMHAAARGPREGTQGKA